MASASGGAVVVLGSAANEGRIEAILLLELDKKEQGGETHEKAKDR